jgi:hypothetical protein
MLRLVGSDPADQVLRRIQLRIRQTLINARFFFTAFSLLLCSLALSGRAAAQVVQAQPPYTVTPFVYAAPPLYSAPDSIVQWRNSILVGYGNGVAKDGSDGKSSTIVQYSLSGQSQRVFNVLGHNDGLLIRPGTNELWAIQNEDGNPNNEPNLIIIDLESLTQKSYLLASVNGGGGYDDVVFKNGQIFITASNPQFTTHYPVLVRLTLAGNSAIVDPVLYSDATAVDIPTGSSVTLNLTDPDSLTIDPRGNLVLDSQGDGELVFIRHSRDSGQEVGRILITTPPSTPTTVDDTAFAPSSRDAFLLAADLNGNTVYRIDSPSFGFEPGVAYSASDTAGIIGVLDLDNGMLTPVITSKPIPPSTQISSFRGLLFATPAEE